MGTEMQGWRREALTGIERAIENVAADFAGPRRQLLYWAVRKGSRYPTESACKPEHAPGTLGI